MAAPIQPQYTVIVEDATGKWQEFEKFTSLQFGYSLNRGSVAQLVCPINYEKITEASTAPRLSWLRVYRKDNPGDSDSERKLVWYGQLFQPEFKGNGLNGQVVLNYEDLTNLLSYRYVDSDYSVTALTDQSQILWNIINDSQGKTGGSLSITQGSAPTSKSRKPKKDLRGRTIKEVMEAYSNLIDGVDWEITPTPKNESIGSFNTYYRGATEAYHKGNVIGVPLQYYTDFSGRHRDNNVANYDMKQLGSEFGNDILIRGATIGATQLEGTDSDATSKGVYGLFEKVIDETDLSEQGTLSDRATEELSSSVQVPRVIDFDLIPHIQPRFGDYDVGDIFPVKFKHFNIEFEGNYRLYAMNVTVDSKGVERIKMILNIV